MLKDLKASYNSPVLIYINVSVNRLQECTGKLFLHVLTFLKNKVKSQELKCN